MEAENPSVVVVVVVVLLLLLVCPVSDYLSLSLSLSLSLCLPCLSCATLSILCCKHVRIKAAGVLKQQV